MELQWSDEGTPNRTVGERRLPDVPRRTGQLFDKIVTSNMAERQWDASVVVLDRAPTSFDYIDPALSDPHLQTYYKRKSAYRTPVPKARRATSEMQVRMYEPNGNDDVHSRKQQACAAVEELLDEQHPSVRCTIPVNPSPFDQKEIFCLKNLLCPLADLQSSVSLDHIDLIWLKKVMDGKQDVCVPAQWKTLSNFSESVLSNDSFHYTTEIPFHEKLVNSPRSALVLLRNGVKAYDLLERPREFYALPSESVLDSTLNLRRQLAEDFRSQLLVALRQQYEHVCAIISRQELVDQVSERPEVDQSEAREVADRRFARDVANMKRQEDRQRRFADILMQKEEEAEERARAMDTKICCQREELRRRLKERGEALRMKSLQRQALIVKLRELQNQQLEETAQEMQKIRDERSEKILAAKSLRIEELRQRAATTAARIEESKARIRELEQESAEALQDIANLKKERAEMFLQRRAEARRQQQLRLTDEGARRLVVREKAAACVADLKNRVEDKLAAAAVRYEEFCNDKQDELRLQHLIRQVRELKSKRVAKKAYDHELERCAQIDEHYVHIRARLESRKQRSRDILLRQSEVREFENDQRQRLVSTKAQQHEFQKLVQLSMMQQLSEANARNKFLEEQVILLTRENRKSLNCEHHAIQLRLENERIQKGKAAFQKRHQLT